MTDTQSTPAVKAAPQYANGINVYLAGKITKHGWRTQHVPSLRYAYSDSDLYDGEPWPTIEDGIAPFVHYVGPFFTSCDHGCAHGNDSHGFAGGCMTTADAHHFAEPDDTSRLNLSGRWEVAQRCLDAIDLADFVIAQVSEDAHGTIAEIGYASAKGKNIVVCYTSEEAQREAWFVGAMPGVLHGHDVATVLNGIAELASYYSGCALVESPIEQSFWHAIAHAYVKDFKGFRPQVWVGTKYRLDFAHEGDKIAIELDGYEYHSSKDQFTKDRQRQRELEQLGWRILRFSGREIHADPYACAVQAIEWLKAVR